MVGVFVAATVVSLAQFLRVRDSRLLLLAAMFACQSQALAREWYDVWRDVFQAGVCAAGMALVLALSPRTAHPPSKRPAVPEKPEEPEPAAGDGSVRA
jgi:hypothetical protein